MIRAGILLMLGALVMTAESRQEIDLGGPGWTLWRDAAATWQDDGVLPPPVDLAQVPVRPPTGGWATLGAAPDAVPCAVPGTVEEYLGDGLGPDSVHRLQGVAWFWRDLVIPPEAAGRLVRLEFGGIRQRAEVFLGERLVGYDAVGMAPFTCDLPAVPGRHRLAVRVTNPGGNYEWNDERALTWGPHRIPMSHAFGGFMDGVRLVIRDPVGIDDLWVRNTPEPRRVVVTATIANPGTTPIARHLEVTVLTAGGQAVVPPVTQAVTIPPGGLTLEVPVHAPAAALWDLDQPVLHTAQVVLRDADRITDRTERRFGFRWFAPEGVGSDAVFRLNGQRILVRTAISWGFWPITGLYPTPDLAARQVRVAKDLGLNMLNFHRSPGHPVVLEEADRQGLLYYQEPGGYVSVGTDPVGQALARERLLRLVRRDRSHPSLVIHNLINENWKAFGADRDPALMAVHRRDLQDAHRADPSRTYTYTSSWITTTEEMAEEPAKMHLRPYDPTVHLNGWLDHHRAGGPMVYRAEDYRGPDDFYARTTNRREIVFHGEEGAVSSPPQLDRIVAELDRAGRPGWDGAMYRQWHQRFSAFLDRKGLRGTWPTVDDFCRTLGRPALEHQGRKILLSRINDLVDGYAVNGWEAQVIENHSGIVDGFRFPKGDPALMADRCRPVQLAVMPRQLTLGSPGTITVDVFLLQDGRLAPGPADLQVEAVLPDGTRVPVDRRPVTVPGGDIQGHLLARDLAIPIPARCAGRVRVEARIARADTRVAEGHDEVLAVDWRSQRLPGRGAVADAAGEVLNHLASRGAEVQAYDPAVGPCDWIVQATSPSQAGLVPATALGNLTMTVTTPDGQELLRRAGGRVDLDVGNGAPIDATLPIIPDVHVTWEGTLTAPEDGTYVLELEGRHPMQLDLDGRRVIDDTTLWKHTVTAAVNLRAGVPVRLRVATQKLERVLPGAIRCLLSWRRAVDPARIADLTRRCQDEGTTLILLTGAAEWLAALQPPGITVHEDFDLSLWWTGGQYAARPHPLWGDLPAGALDSAFGGVQDEKAPLRRALTIDGEETVVAAWRSWPLKLGTAVGVVPWGKGRIIFSTLAIADRLQGDDQQHAVARYLLGRWIATRP